MSRVTTHEKFSTNQRDELFRTLKNRFEENMNRHKDLEWHAVYTRLEASPGKLWSLNEMEGTAAMIMSLSITTEPPLTMLPEGFGVCSGSETNLLMPVRQRAEWISCFRG
jgi:hypothetical protein